MRHSNRQNDQYLFSLDNGRLSRIRKRRLILIMLLLLLFYCSNFVNAHLEYSKENFCLDEIPSNTLRLKCPENQLIQLGRIVYGFSWSNDCSYIDKDCTMDVPRDDVICQSISNCTVRVVEYPLLLQECWNLAATYIQAEYECIQDYSLQNLCENQDTSLSHGYVSSPSYPHGFSSYLNCFCTLSPPAGHSIVLELLDFHLSNCSESGLILWTGDDVQTKCSIQNPMALITNPQQNLTFRFYSLASRTHGGFLMKYSILPHSNNATLRLQCSHHSRPGRTTLPTKPSSSSFGNIIDLNDIEQSSFRANLNVGTRQFHRGLSSLVVNPDALAKSFDQKIFHSSNTNYSYTKKPPHPISTSTPSTNLTLLIICITAGILFFLVVINILIWFIFAVRPKSSKSTRSQENLYSHPAISTVEREILPSPPPLVSSNRLKTLHSLLYPDRKTPDIVSITRSLDPDRSSNFSDLRRSSKKQDDESQYKSTYSSSTNLTHGFFIKPKLNPLPSEPREINSWDDI